MRKAEKEKGKQEQQGRGSRYNSISGVLHKSGCVTSVGRAVSLPDGGKLILC